MSASNALAAQDTLVEARGKLTAALAAAGKEPAALEARLLLEAATALTSLELALRPDLRLDAAQAARLNGFLTRRLADEPVSRILGHSGFFGLDLLVGPDVLDPRADTEILVDVALKMMKAQERVAPRVVDLGTGSGAVLCALLDARPDAFGIGVDLSEAACDLARRNLLRNNLAGRGCVVRGNWAQSLSGRFDLIVSNPPYIGRGEMASLPREVFEFDPGLALDGGLDGLDAYRQIIADLARLLGSGGIACLEIGWRQGDEVVAIFASAGFRDVSVSRDIAGRDRVVAARVP